MTKVRCESPRFSFHDFLVLSVEFYWFPRAWFLSIQLNHEHRAATHPNPVHLAVPPRSRKKTPFASMEFNVDAIVRVSVSEWTEIALYDVPMARYFYVHLYFQLQAV